MGYQVYEDSDARDAGVIRWAGYGVPALCDMPDCAEEIDRGLGYKCEEHAEYHDDEDDGEEEIVEGCGLYFCSKHLNLTGQGHEKATPKPDTEEWVRHILTDESWQRWRDENPERVEAMRQVVPADAQ